MLEETKLEAELARLDAPTDKPESMAAFDELKKALSKAQAENSTLARKHEVRRTTTPGTSSRPLTQPLAVRL